MQQQRDGPAAEEFPGTHGYDQAFIKWVPIVVPLFAVLLMFAVYLIDTAVLKG